MQNQAPALRHFSQFSNPRSGTCRDFFVTHHASNDDSPQSFTGQGFQHLFNVLETCTEKWSFFRISN